MPKQLARKERVIYSICAEDVKQVLDDEFETRLTPRQMKIVEEKLGDYIDWYGALSLAIAYALSQTTKKK